MTSVRSCCCSASCCSALGLAANFVASERSLHPRTRVLAGRGVLAALALGLIAIVIGIAAAPGGINGQASKAWSS